MKGLRHFGPAVAWMAVIFVFSTSLFGGEETGSVLGSLIGLFFPDVSEESLDLLHILIRKAGHLAEYAVLAGLWFRGLVKEGGAVLNKAVLLSFAVSVFYAATDEFHQYFVPNRTASVGDVMVDACGAALCLLVLTIRTKKRRHPGSAFRPCGPA